MVMTARKPKPLLGHASPRVAPPIPARSDIAALREVAVELGIEFMPWQETSGRYTEAQAADGRHLYQEVCEVASRQNGKTEKMVPVIVRRLRQGRRIVHTAQNRDLPREVFARVADIMSQDMTLFPQRNGRVTRPRFANGQEEIKLTNGGRYKIVAPTRGGARGDTNDDVIVDEIRELETLEFIGAVKPTMTASPDPQILYYSNAGTEESIVLNSIRARAGLDPRLAYLEWSAAPERSSDDIEGWLEANPAIGHLPTMLEYLRGEYVSNKLAGTLAIFETEHLCRWVVTMRERLVDEYAWAKCEGETSAPSRPSMAVSMDPDGERASAVIAWQAGDDIAMRVIFDVTGHPIDTDALGADLKKAASRLGVPEVAYDPLTDGELAKFFKKTRKVSGSEYANASARFVTIVNAKRLVWSDAAAVTDDLTFTAKKPHDESGSFQAVRAKDDRPIPAALAAIRAVYLASGPKTATPRVM
jgi:hypothetical protein